jgi:hypothetical protein
MTTNSPTSLVDGNLTTSALPTHPRRTCAERALYQREYQATYAPAYRLAHGHRAVIQATCATCAGTFNTYLGMTKCIRCRQLRVPR